MKTAVCEMLDIEFPLFAFTRSPQIVAEVTNAGGFGVFAAAARTPEALEADLAWIDAHVAGRPYGADLVIPEKFEGKGEILEHGEVVKRVPPEHRAFVAELLRKHGIDSTEDEILAPIVHAVGEEIGEKLLDVVFRHPVKLVANALGVPPKYMIERAREANIPVAALVGAKEHAIRQVEAGVDLLVAQGTEAGGHCGEVTTLVLVPEVIAAIKPIREVPVLAAGGIVTGQQMAAAVALGAAGAWTGSVWLTAEEADTAPYTVQKMLAASSRDTVRSSGRTGKPSRQLTSMWTEAWDKGPNPGPLPMPLQAVISEPSLSKVDELAEQGHPGAQDLATYWVGQGVGLMNEVRSARDIVLEIAEGYIEATERLAATLEPKVNA